VNTRSRSNVSCISSVLCSLDIYSTSTVRQTVQSCVLCDNVFNLYKLWTLTIGQSKQAILIINSVNSTSVSLFIGCCQSIKTSLYYTAVQISVINCSNKALGHLSISCLKHSSKHLLVLCNWLLPIHCSINV